MGIESVRIKGQSGKSKIGLSGNLRILLAMGISYKRVLHCSLVVAGISVLVLILPIDYFLKIFAAVALACCVILVPMFMWGARTEQGQVLELVSGKDCWVHWQYGDRDREDWKQLAEAELTRKLEKWWVAPAVIFTWCAVGLLMSWGRATARGIVPEYVSFTLALCCLAALVTYARARYRYSRRLRGPGEVYIGPHGIFCNGRFRPLNERLTPVSVRLIEGNPLQISFEFGRDEGGRPNEMRVLVPRGHEGEAETLLLHLGGKKQVARL